MIWVVSETEIPDEGDIEREDNNSYAECNKKTIIQQVCKLYKPSLWNNMGFGFVTPKQYKIIKSSTPGKLNWQKLASLSSKKSESSSSLSSSTSSTPKKTRTTFNSLSRESIGYDSEPETINHSQLPLKKRAISETMNNFVNNNDEETTNEITPRPRKKGKFVEAIELTKNIITEEAIKNLPEPPPSVWRRGKRNVEEKAKIEEWENVIKELGYSPADYKRFVYLKRKEKEKYKSESSEQNEPVTPSKETTTNESLPVDSNPKNDEDNNQQMNENTSNDDDNQTKNDVKESQEDDLDDVTTLLYAMSKNN